jgi:excinuclease ABC subunit A
LYRLVEHGNTVLVIEHNLDIIKVADHIIDLGPEGGKGGGEILFTGTPEELAKNKRSYTAPFLKKELEQKSFVLSK